MGVFTICFSFVSFILIFLYRPLLKPFGSKMEAFHVIIGFVIVVMMLAQGYLGYVSDKKFSLERTSIPWWDKLHWWVGRSLFLFGIVNVYIGILIFESKGNEVAVYIKGIYFGIIAIGALAFVYGQVKLGQDNHVKDE